MKRYLPLLISLTLLTTLAAADAIHVWSNGQTLRTTDLNANFAHVHTLMVGGGLQGTPHNLLVDSDISSSANIQLSKIQHSGIFPRAWASFAAGTRASPCDGLATADTQCTVGTSTNVTRVSSLGSTGTYQIFLNYLPTDSNYLVQVTTHRNSLAGDTLGYQCDVAGMGVGTLYVNASSSPQITIACGDTASDAVNMTFDFVVYDDN